MAGSDVKPAPIAGADAHLYNADLAPTPPAGRTWGWASIAALWVGMVVCVPTYLLASGLVKAGMSWQQAVGTVTLGNVIVLVPMALVGHAGTQHGIPFPVLSRAAFGTTGANIPAVLRGLVACGWFGINTWIGGSAIYALMNAVSDNSFAADPIGWLGINHWELACFVGFWALHVFFIAKGTESIRWLETYAAPFLVAMGLALLYWAYAATDGFDGVLDTPGTLTDAQFWDLFWPSLTGAVGFWATLSLNIPDFTRYCKTQRDQLLGQAVGLPPMMALFAFIAAAVTLATVPIFGSIIDDPVKLLTKMGGTAAVLALFVLAVATLTTNLAANVVAPANGFSNINPKRISFKMGGYITAGLGLVIFPWKLIASTGGYIFTWLVGYSALLGPIAGILIADYFWVRRTAMNVEDLFRREGRYTYRKGVNPIAVIALIIGVLPNVPGFLKAGGFVESVPEIFTRIYVYAWFVGFFISGLIYAMAMGRKAPSDA